MKISVVVDSAKSWMKPYALAYVSQLRRRGYAAVFVRDTSKLKRGDIAIFLSCEKLVSAEILALHTRNLVVHESKLPKGRGMSPLTWQILEGKNKIPVTLFEVVEAMDAGDVYFQEVITYSGSELVEELREKQAQITFQLIDAFLKKYPRIRGRRQRGRATYYRRRRPQDSELNIHKSIKSQFNLLRVVDNERYPAHFVHRGRKYIVKIYAAEE